MLVHANAEHSSVISRALIYFIRTLHGTVALCVAARALCVAARALPQETRACAASGALLVKSTRTGE